MWIHTVHANSRRSWRLSGPLGAWALVLSACVPGQPGQARPEAPAAPIAPKTITIVMNRDPSGFGPHQSTDTNLTPLFQATLIRYKVWDGNFEPWVAEEMPSLEKGTWRVLADDRMEATWRLRRNVRWHDGTPFSARDLVFGWHVVRDPQFAAEEAAIPARMESVTAVDDYTLVIVWKQLYIFANLLVRGGLHPMPRHLLEADFRRDPSTFAGHPFFTTQYVGNGPYRVTSFEPGLGIRFDAFNDYFFGRPKIDTIIYRVVADQNIALAQVLSNDVDLTMRSAIGFTPSLTAKEQWEARGEGAVHHVPTGWSWINPSRLNPFFDDVRVRRAMLHAIDRQGLADTIFQGLTGIPDTFIRPSHPRYPDVNPLVQKYPYDPNRARAVMSEAGWRPGSDGILVNGRGERFAIESRASAGDREGEAVQAIVHDHWRPLGIETRINNLSRRASDSPDSRGRWPGVRFGSGSLEPTDPLHTDWHSRYTPTEANDWTGDNVAGWSRGDRLLEQWEREIDPARRRPIEVQIALIWAEDLPHLPLYFNLEITTVKKGILGAAPRLGSGGSNAMTWNIHEWDRV
jgi:peptide/nickel transport system substrate-binding protein